MVLYRFFRDFGVFRGSYFENCVQVSFLIGSVAEWFGIC